MNTILVTNNKLKLLEEKQRILNLKITKCKEETIKQKLLIQLNKINCEYIKLVKNLKI